jgi:hypothetical protein
VTIHQGNCNNERNVFGKKDEVIPMDEMDDA